MTVADVAVADVHVVDVHTHFMPVGLPDLAASTGDGRWPKMVPGPGAAGDIMCGQNRFRRVSAPCWDVPARLAAMDTLGVDTQVVSPVPVSLTYWADGPTAAVFAREHNDLLAEAVATAGGRLVALGSVPLQDTDLALDELRRVVDDLGMAGVEIGTVVGDDELDSPRLRPFFAEAARRGTPVFVHPTDGEGATRCSDPVGAFGLGLLADTGVAGHALVYGGVLAALPELRICLSHGGGAYALAHHRMRYLAGVLAGDARAERSRELDELAGLLWSDALVFDPTHLEVAAAVFGSAHLMVGTDFPFVEHVAAAGAALAAGSDGIRGANAARFFGPTVAGLTGVGRPAWSDAASGAA